MTCFLFFILVFLLAVIAGMVALGYFGGKRIAWHLKQRPEAAKELADAISEHVIIPLLTATDPKADPKLIEVEPKEESKPKKIKATLI